MITKPHQKTLFLKTSHTWVVEHRKLCLARKTTFEWTSKLSLLASYHSAGEHYIGLWGRKDTSSFMVTSIMHAAISICLTKYAHMCSSGKAVYEVTNIYLELIWGLLHQRYSCMALKAWSKPISKEAIDPKREHFDVVLLNIHAAKLTSKCFL